MFAQKFFKLFPPPKFLDIPYAGLDISDEAVRCIEYGRTRTGLVVHRHGSKSLPPGAVESGEIKNMNTVKDAIASLAKELQIHTVRASLPEEKMYLFQTEVPTKDVNEIYQNIEFKLEENVPLSPAESVFFFDEIPKEISKGAQNAVSVSVAPRSLIESYLEVIKAAGVSVMSFEVQPKAIAKALTYCDSTETEIIVYIMKHKTGIYIVCGGVVCFTSTFAWGNTTLENAKDPRSTFVELKRQIKQVFTYWLEHGQGKVSRVVFAGHGSLTDGLISECSVGFLDEHDQPIRFEVGKVWQNAFHYDAYIPPVSHEDSLDYVVAAGLALPPVYC